MAHISHKPGAGAVAAAAAPALRAVIVSRIFEPEPAAASFRLKALRGELVARGFVVDVLTTTVPGEAERATRAVAGKISRWPALRNREGYVRGYLPYLSFDLPVLFRLLAHRTPDIVIVEPPPTTGVMVRLASALLRRPYVYYAADIWSMAARSTGAPRPVLVVLRAVERFALNGAARVVTVYPALVERINELAPGSSLVLTGHGADVTSFRPDGGRSAIDGPYLVYAGTASEVHGAGVFVDAMGAVLDAIPAARLVVIGQGEDRPAMEEAARRFPPGTVRFLPRLSPRDTAEWIRGAHAALASVRPGPYGFALATKVFAAAACGVRTLYVGGGDGAALVNDNALGEVVDYELSVVADAMIRMLRSPAGAQERERIATWAREHGSLEAAARRVADQVERVVAERQRRGSR